MKRLKELRKSKYLTLYELSKELNISPQVLSRYELEERKADYETLHKIASYFDVSIDYLLGYTPYYYPDNLKTSAPMDNSYSFDERQLIENYRKLNASGKKLIDTTFNTLLTTAGGSEQKKHRN